MTRRERIALLKARLRESNTTVVLFDLLTLLEEDSSEAPVSSSPTTPSPADCTDPSGAEDTGTPGLASSIGKPRTAKGAMTESLFGEQGKIERRPGAARATSGLHTLKRGYDMTNETATAAYTPGPWKAVHDLAISYIEIQADDEGSCTIATIDLENVMDPKPALADARLIAAAPALLEALASIMADSEDEFDGEQRYRAERVAQARAAIEAARSNEVPA